MPIEGSAPADPTTLPTTGTFHRSVMDSLQDHAIVVTDESGIIRYWNDAATNIFGYLAGEVAGQAIAVLYTPEDRDAGVDMQERQTAVAAGRSADERWHMRKDGTRCFISEVLQPVRNGHLQGFVKVMRDETSRKEMEVELREAKAKADQANASKDHFIAVLSHELRTPLTPALAILGSLHGDSELPESVKADLEVVLRNVELEARIIDDLLDYTRISRGKMRLSNYLKTAAGVSSGANLMARRYQSRLTAS